MKVDFVDQHKDEYGVQPVCEALKDTPPRSHRGPTTPPAPRPPSARTLRDEELTEEIEQIHAENYGVYGARKVQPRCRDGPRRWPAARSSASCARPGCAG